MRFNVSHLINAPIGTQGVIHIDEQDIVFDENLFVRDLTGDILLTRINRALSAKGQLDATVDDQCTRCLTTLVLSFAVQFDDLSFAFPLVPHSHTLYRIMEGGWLNPGPALLEQIVLSFPSRSLCHTECRGLCSQCGQNLNVETCQCDHQSIDPRLAVLRDLL